MTVAERLDLADDDIGQRIIRAAADCFTRDGYAGTSTAAIAREAKTSKRALYQRFPNKEALFENVMHEICARAADATPRPAAPHGDDASLEDVLRALGVAVVDRFAMPETRAIFIAAVSAIPDAPNVIDIFWNEGPGQAADVIAKALSRAKKQRKIKVLRAKEAARWFVYECAGPVVLGRLFSANFRSSRQLIDAHVDNVVARFLKQLESDESVRF